MMKLTRRTILLTASAALCDSFHLPALAADGTGPATTTSLPLWPGLPPGGGGPTGSRVISTKGAITNIASPTLDVFQPPNPSGAAMLVAAGGGYKRNEAVLEAVPAARWLVAHGITAFVLTYRLPSEGWSLGPLAPLQDAQRAVRLIRSGAIVKGIDPARVGVLGFSAGGHLMGMTAARSTFQSYEPLDRTDAVSPRPDLCALAYPVITLQAPYGDTSTRRMLVGRHPSKAVSAEWSVETYVDALCPPTFVIQAADDAVSNPANSAILEQAYKLAGVAVERHLAASGGHGFGMGKAGTPTEAWPMWLSAWLRANNWSLPADAKQ